MKIIQYLISGIFLFFLSSLLSAQQSTKQDTLRELWRRIDILTQELERAKLGKVAEAKYESRYGMGPAASSVYHLTNPGISIAGYGEIIYENFSREQDDGFPSRKFSINILTASSFVE